MWEWLALDPTQVSANLAAPVATVVGMFALLFLFLARGWLVTANHVRQMREDASTYATRREAELQSIIRDLREDRDRYRLAWETTDHSFQRVTNAHLQVDDAAIAVIVKLLQDSPSGDRIRAELLARRDVGDRGQPGRPGDSPPAGP